MLGYCADTGQLCDVGATVQIPGRFVMLGQLY